MQFSVQSHGFLRVTRLFVLPVALLLSLLGGTGPRADNIARQRVIVQGHSVDAATTAVRAVGGTVGKELGLIHAVSAELAVSAIPRLQRSGVRVSPDYAVQAADDDEDEREENHKGEETAGLNLYPRVAVGAHLLGKEIDGRGVTVAYVDSGFPAMESEAEWDRKVDKRTLLAGDDKYFVVYRDLLFAGTQITNSTDPYGHGTHVAMAVADNRQVLLAAEGDSDDDGLPEGEMDDEDDAEHVSAGIAPGSNIVMVRALDEHGQGEYSTVIEAIDWIVANRKQFDIRILNLSLDGVPAAPYWFDPLGQAVMRAWEAGLVVVAAAGNQGPAPMTIGVPGNVPYAIGVGALTSGRYTTSGADELAVYSSVGPTESKFVKPDVVVPATRTLAALPKHALLAGNKKTNLVEKLVAPVLPVGRFKPSHHGYYQLSGTSMAAAEASGIVALLLQQQPKLTNNQVKYRLTATARPAGEMNEAQYSIWQQGAGRLDAVAAVNGTTTEEANRGMDIQADLKVEDGTHYLGPTEFDPATDSFYITGQQPNGGTYGGWNGTYQSWAGGTRTWSGSYQGWAGSFQSWAGGTRTWSGSLQSWAGSFQTWAGSFQTWADEYQQKADIVDSSFKVYLPLLQQ